MRTILLYYRYVALVWVNRGVVLYVTEASIVRTSVPCSEQISMLSQCIIHENVFMMLRVNCMLSHCIIQ